MDYIHHILDNAASKCKTKTAIITRDEIITYQQVQEISYQFGNFLLGKGLKKGDRILLKLPNSIDLICLLIGISRVGGISVIINPETTKYNLDYIISDCRPKLIICEENNPFKISNSSIIFMNSIKKEIKNYDKHKLLSDEIEKIDLALLIYTSGSTGRPKAVVSTHSNVKFCTKEISEVLEINDRDVIGNFLPFSFDYGLYQIFLSFYNKATLALGEVCLAGVQFVKFLKEWKVTVLPSMPHLTEGLIKLLPRYCNYIPLRIITNTGESLPLSYISKLEELIPNCEIYPMYGLTECKRVSILKPDEIANKPGSVGKPLRGVKCYVVNEQGNKLKAGEIGELVVEGPNVMAGYWNNNTLTNEKFKKNIHGEINKLYTGDSFKIDGDGYLYFIGRKGDYYKQKGFRISSKEIEDAVYNLNLAEIAILIPPDDLVNKSVLFLKTEKSLSYVKEKLIERIEPYKMPDEILILKKMPVSMNKKIDKSKLKEIRSQI
ncbi:class I adenylate-forming enzyme family protein [Bacillus sp. FSL R5-0654]|uniref:class I adenylate-forming enzyme family protein n=1 Tax=Bacillus TaxID=1386 RepID=UPI0028805A05|nr:class I adenylate-forming enzyme family protein [Bacillus sp. SG20001]WNF51272.1 class I adenylate-forming enzyme family protein [Bacillus sp. SG20001]